MLQDDDFLRKVINLVKDRCTLLPDFVQQGGFFFQFPETIDLSPVKPKWDRAKNLFFTELVRTWQLSTLWEAADMENTFKELAAVNQLKPGELMLPLRIMLVGGKYGPGVFDIAQCLGKEATIHRIQHILGLLQAP